MKFQSSLWIVGLVAAVVAHAADSASAVASAMRYESGQTSAALAALDQQLRESVDNPAKRAALEEQLIQMLGPESTLESKLFACQRLSIIGTEASLGALAGLLPAEETVGMACLALANYPTGKADVVLRRALEELEGVSRLQVIATLGNRRDRGASRALSRLVWGPDTAAAAAATLALGRIADGTARRTLADLRREPVGLRQEVVEEASLLEAESLATDGASDAALELYETLLKRGHSDPVRAGALAALLRLEPGRAEARIHSLLRRDDPELMPDEVLRPVAIAAVGNLRSATSGLVFAGELDRLPVFERTLLISALAEMGSYCPRAALAAQLGSDSTEVRLAVIRAFTQLNQPADCSVFIRALARAEGQAERQAVEAALVQLPGEADTDELLLNGLEGAPPNVRQGLLNALARRGASAAVPALFEAASSADPGVARAGLQGLGRLAGPAELPAMLDLYVSLPAGGVRDDAERALARILGRMPDVEGRGQAVRAKLEEATETSGQAALVRLLPLAGGSEALAAARGALVAEDPGLRDAAVRALAEWPDESALGDLMGVYEGSSQSTHRVLALRGLTRLAAEANQRPTEALVARYRDLLALAATEEERRMILGVLGGCPDPGALALALEQRRSAGVRAEAEQAVRRIADTIKGAHPEAAAAALEAVDSGL